jgi:hypothetical protein
MSSEPQHYLVVPFPELAEVIDPWRKQSLGSGASKGVPPHVTLLAPCPGDEKAIAEVLEDAVAFDVEFRELRRFTQVPTLWLAPEPSEPFVGLTAALVERFPDWRPYGGIHGTEVIPHLTVTQGPAEDAAQAALTPLLSLRGRAREAILLVEAARGRFETASRFAFRSS